MLALRAETANENPHLVFGIFGEAFVWDALRDNPRRAWCILKLHLEETLHAQEFPSAKSRLYILVLALVALLSCLS